jgi:catechol 2,3-dioxygenase-like lactoylglutathione lyase family enzyme
MGVTGIGGLFFRADDPEALAIWYRTHLGVGGDAGAGEWYWRQSAGPTVFAPFKRASDYFPADRQHMLNLRVEGLSAMIETLKAAGIAVETRAEWDDPATGRFARIHDPDGNPIELWEPPAG